MSILDFILLVVLPSGVIGAVAGGLVNYISGKKLDVHVRTMETRKSVYTDVNELLAVLFSTVPEEETNAKGPKILEHFRAIQIWGSDDVLRCFNRLLHAINLDNNVLQTERDQVYKDLVIAMRSDILSGTNIGSDDIQVHGHIRRGS